MVPSEGRGGKGQSNGGKEGEARRAKGGAYKMWVGICTLENRLVGAWQ